ncbi:Fcf2 pre-rRNA processing-domain-containing protein [Crassisporium funariophilum]|nr:Fcf2 pre-rRNA processing-domain-containing protein [Crassisporium funariophilum]
MLDPGYLPRPYIQLGATRFDGPSSVRDPDVELAANAASSHSVPAPPIPPPELTKSGKPLTKKQKKELKHITSGPDWFDLPAPAEADLPRLYREVEALRLRNQLDSKRFYKKDEGEGKGIKGLPKYFAIGTIIPSTTPFGTASGDNLTRANRKRTLVDELVDDAEAKRYAKKKFEDLQSARGAKGKNTLRAKQALRKGKW